MVEEEVVENLNITTEENMNKTVESLRGGLKKVRTGRAQVSMLDNVKADCYGSLTPMNQMAAISCPDPKSFLIAPWDANLLKSIETAIVRSDLGMSPQNDGKVIRLKLPELTEDRRKELVKTIKKMTEDAKVAIRMARRDANEALKKALKEKKISEDEQKRSTDEIQKLTDTFIKKVDGIMVEKEKDLMTL